MGVSPSHAYTFSVKGQFDKDCTFLSVLVKTQEICKIGTYLGGHIA
jgi:hypothetical protein